MIGIQGCEHRANKNDCPICKRRKASAVHLSDGLSCPWDTLENPEDGCWSNFIAWEKWMKAKDDRDLFDEIDILPRTFIYCMMVDLLEAR